MLGKLIKYDLKALAKILAPLWGVLLVMGIIFGISIRSNLEGIGNTMIVFSLVVIVAVIVAIFVVNVIIVIQRFWKGLLQEEGYLMFTLPVTTRSLILSKVISALIISCGTAFVISLLGVEIIAISPVKLMDTATYFGNWVIKVHAGPWIGYGAIIAVVSLLSSIYHVYAAMVIGQLSNGNRFLFAFVAYAALSIIVSLIGIPTMESLGNMGSWRSSHVIHAAGIWNGACRKAISKKVRHRSKPPFAKYMRKPAFWVKWSIPSPPSTTGSREPASACTSWCIISHCARSAAS